MKPTRPIPDFPAYAIAADGEVYRVLPDRRADTRYGSVPRRISVVMCGTKGKKLSPSVTLTRAGRQGKSGGEKRTVRALMRLVWPEVEWK